MSSRHIKGERFRAHNRGITTNQAALVSDNKPLSEDELLAKLAKYGVHPYYKDEKEKKEIPK